MMMMKWVKEDDDSYCRCRYCSSPNSYYKMLETDRASLQDTTVVKNLFSSHLKAYGKEFLHRVFHKHTLARTTFLDFL